jgi:hypothetical protein
MLNLVELSALYSYVAFLYFSLQGMQLKVNPYRDQCHGKCSSNLWWGCQEWQLEQTWLPSMLRRRLAWLG